MFSGYRGVGSDVTEKRRSEERLSYLALHDSLTDLPNRVLFHQLQETARARLAQGDRFAVLALDGRALAVGDAHGTRLWTTG